MSRTLAAATEAHAEGTHIHPVLLARIDFTTPVYAHTGLGIINFESNDYLGIGNLGGLSGLSETENLVPSPVTMTLTGLDSNIFTESMNAANYGDKVFLYIGYRNDDGTLVGTPWNFYKGRVEHGSGVRGSDNSVSIIVQHVLAILNKKIGTRYTDESQQKKSSGDLGLQFVAQMKDLKLTWGHRDPATIDSGANRDDDWYTDRGQDIP